METHFQDLDNLVLDLKGLVLVRQLREQSGAAPDELGMFTAQIENVRHRLASLVETGALAERPAA
jgi:hypothetical protein